MSLTSGEQRRLAEIESQLCGADPGLAAMFARFTARAPHRRPLAARLARYRQGPDGPRRVIILILASVTLVIALIAVAVVATLHGTPSRGGHAPGLHPVGVFTPLG